MNLSDAFKLCKRQTFEINRKKENRIEKKMMKMVRVHFCYLKL